MKELPCYTPPLCRVLYLSVGSMLCDSFNRNRVVIVYDDEEIELS